MADIRIRAEKLRNVHGIRAGLNRNRIRDERGVRAAVRIGRFHADYKRWGLSQSTDPPRRHTDDAVLSSQRGDRNDGRNRRGDIVAASRGSNCCDERSRSDEIRVGSHGGGSW